MDKDTLSVMELLPAFGRMQGEAWRGLPPKDAREVAALTTSQLKAVMLVAMRELSGGVPMTLGELADALALKKSATSILVTALEEQGLASRRADEENARKVRITLSRRGRSLAERVTTPASERVSAFLGTLGKVERTAFVSVARKFTAFVRGAAMCIALCATLAGCSESQNRQGEDGIVLHGNVDDREMQLAFVISERLEAVMPEEGETVKKGDIVAKCETVRLENDVAVAEATVQVREAELKAAEALLSKSENGSRKEDIAAVTALKSGIAAKLKAAKLTYERNRRLVETHAVSQQDADNAEAAYLFLSHAETTISNLLERLIAGDRMEDRASAAARGGRDAPRPGGRHRANANPRTGRTHRAAETRPDACAHRSEVGAVLRPRDRPRSRQARCKGIGCGGFAPRAVRGMGGLHFADGGVHAQEHRDGRTPPHARL